MSKKDTLAEFKRITDLSNEAMLCTTILRYGQGGHASAAMIEAAIVLVDRHIAYATEITDPNWFVQSTKLKAGLQQVLVDGVASLRVARGPGLEMTEVEEPLAKFRISVGHKLQRQRKCAGGVIDIYDISANQLIECKYLGSGAALGEAASQLRRYRPSFPDAELCIAVLRVEAEALWLADLLRSQGITILEVGGQ